jgi:hypothetical protein
LDFSSSSSSISFCSIRNIRHLWSISVCLCCRPTMFCRIFLLPPKRSFSRVASIFLSFWVYAGFNLMLVFQ